MGTSVEIGDFIVREMLGCKPKRWEVVHKHTRLYASKYLRKKSDAITFTERLIAYGKRHGVDWSENSLSNFQKLDGWQRVSEYAKSRREKLHGSV